LRIFSQRLMRPYSSARFICKTTRDNISKKACVKGIFGVLYLFRFDAEKLFGTIISGS
jgi:hypothetical protein